MQLLGLKKNAKKMSLFIDDHNQDKHSLHHLVTITYLFKLVTEYRLILSADSLSPFLINMYQFIILKCYFLLKFPSVLSLPMARASPQDEAV